MRKVDLYPKDPEIAKEIGLAMGIEPDFSEPEVYVFEDIPEGDLPNLRKYDEHDLEIRDSETGKRLSVC
jgi:hypothetical protein